MADKGTAKYIPEDDKLRLAVMNCHYIKYPLSYFLDSVVHFGFRNIELFGAMPHFFMDDVDDALVDRVRSAGIECGQPMSRAGGISNEYCHRRTTDSSSHDRYPKKGPYGCGKTGV